jgi:hypothetical protein
MHEALADFRIENDSVVLLSFTDGSSYRVDPKDLDRYVSQRDVAAIRRALRLRQQFITRVLPPTLMLLLAAAIIGVGSHDMQRVQAMLHPSTGQTIGAKAAHTVPAATTSKSSHSLPATAPVATTPSASNNPTGAGTVVAASPGKAASNGNPVSSATSTPQSTTQPVSQVTKPLTNTVQMVVAPIAKTVQPVIAPVTGAAGGLLKAVPLP